MDKIKVFISSAMNEEMNGFIKWLIVRKTVADTVRKNDLFEVFTIEEHASADSSNQYMLSMVTGCDVYVLILGSELRYGTAQEYQQARDLHKDMLVYVLNVQHDAECEACLDELRRRDYCTYRKVETVEGLEGKVLDDLVEHVARRYKGLSKSSSVTAGVNAKQESTTNVTTALKHFGRSSLVLGERLGYEYDSQDAASEDAALEPFGEALIDWLMTRTIPSLSEYHEALAELLKESGTSIDEIEVRRLRWSACESYLSGNLDKAMELLENAASKAEDHSHILTSILIDLRNIASERDGYLASHKYQSEIDARGIDSYLSVDAKFSAHVDAMIQGAQDAEWLTPERTTVLGEHRLAAALASISNCVFASASYGSIAGVVGCRVDLARLLMRFSKLYKDESLYVEGLRLLILANDSRDLEQWLIAGFDWSNQELVSRAGELWDASLSVSGGKIGDSGCVILRELGEYLDDERFQRAAVALLERVHSIKGINKSRYFRALSANAHRMNPGLLIHTLRALITRGEIHFMDCIHRCLEDLRIEDTAKEDRVLLASTLEKHYPKLVEERFSATAIALLAKESDDFARLGASVKAQLEGDDLIEYEMVEQSSQVTPEYCIGIIDDAIKQLKANDNPGVQTEFSYSPADLLVRIVTTGQYQSIRNVVEPSLFDLWVQVSSSGAPGNVLDGYVRLAVSLAADYRKAELPLPKEFKSLSRVLVNKQPQIVPLLSKYERRAWNARVSTFGLLCKTGTKRGFLRAISDTWESGVGTREACAECLEAYLEAFQYKAFHDTATIANALSAFSRDKDERVRLISERCAMRLISTPIDFEARETLRRLSRDPRPLIRYGFLKFGPQYLGNCKLMYEIVQYLQGDAHHRIRAKAKSMYEDMGGGCCE